MPSETAPAAATPDVGLADVQSARRTIQGLVRRTPLVTSAVSDDAGVEILLKLETLQPTGSFKVRGASNALARLPRRRRRGVVCVSTGNHGRAVAHAARALGVPATICLSELVPAVKVRAIEALGATVVRTGRTQDDAQATVESLVAERGFTEIPPFDHPHVVAGQGTIALELLEERPDIGTIVVPVSGGGLVGGIALAAKALKPGVRVIGVSMDRGAAMAESLKAGRPVEVEEVPSLADSLGGGIGLANRITFALCRDLVDEMIVLTESQIYRGMQSLFRADRLVAEGASAVGHGAIIAGRIRLRGPTALIVSGCNVDMDQFSAVIAGRAVRLGSLRVTGGPDTDSPVGDADA